jgi:hypothetical protein
MPPLCRDQDWPNLAHFGHNEPHRTLSPFASTPIFASKQKQDAKAADLVVQILDRPIVKSLRGITISAVAPVKVLW